jgi:hypothetical protein
MEYADASAHVDRILWKIDESSNKEFPGNILAIRLSS